MIRPLVRAAILAPLLQKGRCFTFIRSAIGRNRQLTVRKMSSTASSSSSTTINSTEKQIVFVRHSITYMNEYLGQSLAFGQPGFTDIFSGTARQKYQDSPLSPNGIKLVQDELASHCPDFIDDDVDLVVVSPLRRCLQTFDLGIRKHLVGRDVPVVAVHHAAERLYLISDVGSSLEELEEEYPYVNFNEISDRQRPWWFTPRDGAYTEWRPVGEGQRYACPGEPPKAFSERMQRFHEWLRRRPEQKIVVVCHHGVIKWLIDMSFANCEWIQVPFARISPACLADYE
eukprot:scaffold4707_cov164-Amphora_coffeaeformis.AAC.19